jgi:arginine decarboxylase
MFVPQKVFFTKGVGKNKDHLHSFEFALRDAAVVSRNSGGKICRREIEWNR